MVGGQPCPELHFEQDPFPAVPVHAGEVRSLTVISGDLGPGSVDPADIHPGGLQEFLQRIPGSFGAAQDMAQCLGGNGFRLMTELGGQMGQQSWPCRQEIPPPVL